MSHLFLPSDAQLREMLENAKRIAVVGLSDKPDRDSYKVAKYLQQAGYEIIPVNPTVDEVLGEQSVSSLRDIEGEVDIVDVFRRGNQVMPVVEEAIGIKAPAIWFQLGVINEEAAQKATDAGLEVVMDRCIKVEHARLFS